MPKELKSHALPMAISYYDLNLFLSKANKCVEDLTKDELNEILFFIGMEKDDWEVEECLHRPIYSPNNEPWKGKRILGYERQDRKWMYSSKSSLENIIISQRDKEHREDLLKMSKRSTAMEFEEKNAEKHKEEI